MFGSYTWSGAPNATNARPRSAITSLQMGCGRLLGGPGASRRRDLLFRPLQRPLRFGRETGGAARIVARMRRLEKGNPGDTKSVGKGVLEMRIDYGPGYRIYYLHRGAQIVILLCGGDKRTQQQDIRQAQMLAETL